jgi:hypothetical protein
MERVNIRNMVKKDEFRINNIINTGQYEIGGQKKENYRE